MNAPTRLAAFAAAVAALAGGAAVAGGAIDPDRGSDEQAKAGGHGAEPAEHAGAVKAAAIRGLSVAENGLRVVVDDPDLRRGARERLRFRIVDGRGATVRDFDVEHEKRMHLILVRRDLDHFQHLHPVQAADGAWETDVELDAAGSYRLFADFTRDEKAHTLASDLRVDGAADLRPLPRPAEKARTDSGYDVALDRHGEELSFTITRDGRSVDTEPYLGAGGHLVALREGDLAFLHVHPSGDDEVAFETKLPTAGRYRLFLQFEDEGRVHTAAFTEVVR